MSKGLDLDKFKKAWKEQDNFQKNYSQEEIVHLLDKKSRNNVKYILILSTIEVIVSIFSLLYNIFVNEKAHVLEVLPDYFRDSYMKNYQISQILIYSNTIVSIGFLIALYSSYKKINIALSAKDLIRNILKFRRIVNWFITINIIIGVLIVILTAFYVFLAGFIEGFGRGTEVLQERHMVIIIIVSFFICFLFVMLFAFIYYYYLYGFLIRKLKNNLKELKQYDE